MLFSVNMALHFGLPLVPSARSSRPSYARAPASGSSQNMNGTTEYDSVPAAPVVKKSMPPPPSRFPNPARIAMRQRILSVLYHIGVYTLHKSDFAFYFF